MSMEFTKRQSGASPTPDSLRTTEAAARTFDSAGDLMASDMTNDDDGRHRSLEPCVPCHGPSDEDDEEFLRELEDMEDDPHASWQQFNPDFWSSFDGEGAGSHLERPDSVDLRKAPDNRLFEEAKGHVLENLGAVIDRMNRIIARVREGETFEDLDLACPALPSGNVLGELARFYLTSFVKQDLFCFQTGSCGYGGLSCLEHFRTVSPLLGDDVRRAIVNDVERGFRARYGDDWEAFKFWIGDGIFGSTADLEAIGRVAARIKEEGWDGTDDRYSASFLDVLESSVRSCGESSPPPVTVPVMTAEGAG